jgi:hypothetical protein
VCVNLNHFWLTLIWFHCMYLDLHKSDNAVTITQISLIKVQSQSKNRRKNYLCQLLNVHGVNNIRLKYNIYISEPLISKS